MMTPSAAQCISPHSTMSELLEVYPGAQRAIFRKYHIGGCSSCGFDPAETLAQVCLRNGNLDVAEMLAFVRQSQEEDERIWIGAAELNEIRRQGQAHRLLDIRTREEFEATHIDGAIPFTQESMTEILGRWPRGEVLVICDHTGTKCMDAAAYFLGHGFTNVRALRGGIDAWAREVDSSVRRYKLE